MTDEEIGNVVRLVGVATTQTSKPGDAGSQLLAASILVVRLWSKMSQAEFVRRVEQLWPQINDTWSRGGDS